MPNDPNQNDEKKLPWPEESDPAQGLISTTSPVGRSKVARFRETLFEQYISPTQAVEDLSPYLRALG